jgi:uncharacterized protein YneF (UPF0154 family)
MMRNLLLLLFICLFTGTYLHAQVYDSQVEFNKAKRSVKTMEVSQEPDIVEDAIKSKMAKSGYKPSESKGWMVFKNVNDPEISSETCDLYVKVERKSRKEKENSVVYFFASKPGDNLTPIGFAGNMLVSDGFNGQVKAQADAAKLEKDIAAQEDAVRKAQKKYDDLVKDQSSLEKKIQDLQADLEKNKQKQQEQSQEAENQRKILEQLKSRRNG